MYSIEACLDIIRTGQFQCSSRFASHCLEVENVPRITSIWCFATQHEQQHVPRVRILVVWFGANDACIEPSPQHVPLPRFSTNIKRFVNMVSSPRSPHYSSSTHVILVTPPPVNTHQRGADLASRNPPISLDRLFDVTKAYAEAVKVVADEESVALVDVWAEIWKAAGENEHALSQFLVDGLHLNAEGYGVRLSENL
jgi:Lysophospholipase L1 and related esterases